MSNDITTADLMLDKNQGIDKQDRKFGYIHAGDKEHGGYFFTWMPTLAATLDSLDADTQDKPTFEESIAREFLESKIASKFE